MTDVNHLARAERAEAMLAFIHGADSEKGRAILARVAKLEAVAEAARDFRDMPHSYGSVAGNTLLERLADSLDALDAKENQ